MQAFAQAPTCLFMPCHMNFLVTSVRVARIEGCERLCTASNTFLHQDDGTILRGCPDKTSHRRVVFVGPNLTSSSINPVIAVR